MNAVDFAVEVGFSGIGRTVNQAELISKIQEVKHPTFCSLITQTEPDMVKAHPYPGLTKLTYVKGMIGASYSGMMDTVLLKEKWAELEQSEVYPESFLVEHYQPKPRRWGQRVGNLVEHTKDGIKHFYLDTPVLSSKTRYVYGGKFIPNEDVRPYLKQKNQQPVIWRDYKIESVVGIKFNGMVYRVT